MRSWLLGLAVGLVLADSSVVTLALPEILREFDVSITAVSWTLTAYNLALAAAVVPAAYVARRRPRAAFATGLVVFATASLACGLASSLGVLVGARAVQALGGALAVTAALDLLTETMGGAGRAARIWVTAGVLGAALGPAIGGLLTELLGWESIFLAQVPLALLPLAALGSVVAHRIPSPAGRPHLAANAALFLLSGGLVAALFLVVLLLVDGWGMSPATAGLVVTVMPLAAIGATRFLPRAGPLWARMSSGIVLVAGGLGALAVLPRASWPWTVPPQLLIGVGIGLALAALTERAVAGRSEHVVHGGWTLAARHAGVVVGLVLLAPALTTTLDRNEDDALYAGAAAVIDSSVPPLDKVRLAQDVLVEVRSGEAKQRPDIAAAFEDRPDTAEYRSLLGSLQEELDRAVTNAFSVPFLIAAALALGALIPVGLSRGDPL
jgi:MFS family permease